MAEKHFWIPFYYGEYDRDTKDLNLIEHGAYLKLLLYVWDGGRIINSNANAYRIACAFASDEQCAVDSVLQRFFKKGKDGSFSHSRALEILAEQNAQKEKRSKGGQAGAKARWGDKQPQCVDDAVVNANASENDADAIADALTESCQLKSNIKLNLDLKENLKSNTPSHEGARGGGSGNGIDEKTQKLIDGAVDYAVKSQNVNMSVLSWIPAFVARHVEMVRAEKPEAQQALLALWQGTCDIATRSAASSPKFYDRVFEKAWREWKPTDKAIGNHSLPEKLPEQIRAWQAGEPLKDYKANYHAPETFTGYEKTDGIYYLILRDGTPVPVSRLQKTPFNELTAIRAQSAHGAISAHGAVADIEPVFEDLIYD